MRRVSINLSDTPWCQDSSEPLVGEPLLHLVAYEARKLSTVAGASVYVQDGSFWFANVMMHEGFCDFDMERRMLELAVAVVSGQAPFFVHEETLGGRSVRELGFEPMAGAWRLPIRAQRVLVERVLEWPKSGLHLRCSSPECSVLVSAPLLWDRTIRAQMEAFIRRGAA